MLDDESEVVLKDGHAVPAADDEEEKTFVAILWIVDPTERRGWRDLWIEKKKESKPKKTGFGRP